MVLHYQQLDNPEGKEKIYNQMFMTIQGQKKPQKGQIANPEALLQQEYATQKKKRTP
jgi:hypothetical protein